MPILNLSIAADADDGYVVRSARFEPDGTSIQIGEYMEGTDPPNNVDCWLRFTGAGDIAGATITSAILTLTKVTDPFGDVEIPVNWSAAAANNPAAPTSEAEYDSHARTAASVPHTFFTFPQVPPERQIDVTPVIAEVAVSFTTDSLMLFSEFAAPGTLFDLSAAFAAREHATAAAATLVIDYTPAAVPAGGSGSLLTLGLGA